MLTQIAEKISKQEPRINDWFLACEERVAGDPIYASVDVRNAGYKIAPIDTNIFPGGFNNLCPSYRRTAGDLFARYFKKNYPQARRIAILAEEHTRNLYYFENLFTLEAILRSQGFEVAVGSFSAEIMGETQEFVTAEKNTLTIHRATVEAQQIHLSAFIPEVILVNNDFSGGIPAFLKNITQPMIPTPLLGWHTRKKSDHFAYYEKLATEFAQILEIDPWFITADFTKMEEVDFSNATSMEAMAHKADLLLAKIKEKFTQHAIASKPYLVVKNDAGTYGMAVMTVESGDELLHLNKKERTKMSMGKGRRPVTDVIIQEGIETIDRFKGLVAEPVIYLVDNELTGAFFRLNEGPGSRGNLNQPGMTFGRSCFHEMNDHPQEYREAQSKGPCDTECVCTVYRVIARIASFAAGCESKKALSSHV